MYQQLWGYKVEEKLYLGVREQKRLNTTVLEGTRKLIVSNKDEQLILFVNTLIRKRASRCFRLE
jgi:hypothetical protein